MQRWCSKLGRPFLSSFHRRLLLSPISPELHQALPVAFPVTKSALRSTPNRPHLLDLGFLSHSLHFLAPAPALQARHFAAKAKDRSRAPATPVISKLKKYKMKSPSSFKFRFKTLNDGTIRRWRAGKRHNAHLKSKKSKRRLRRPALVHLAYAKVIKKLNFCG